MNYTLKQLKYFVLAGEHGSVTKAAEAIYVSQPSISSAIHHLEDVTGLQLFIRHHAQGLTLTPQGWQFFRRAKNLLKEADELAQFAKVLSSDVSGALNLVGFPTFTSLMMPGIRIPEGAGQTAHGDAGLAHESGVFQFPVPQPGSGAQLHLQGPLPRHGAGHGGQRVWLLAVQQPRGQQRRPGRF